MSNIAFAISKKLMIITNFGGTNTIFVDCKE